MSRSCGRFCRQLTRRRQARGWVVTGLIVIAAWAWPSQVPAIDSAELTGFKRAVRAAEAGKWRQVGELEALLSAPQMRRYLHWQRLLQGEPEPPLEQLADFMNAHPHWPGAVALQARAERQMDHRVGMAARLAFFAERRPLTAEGRLALAEAWFDAGRDDDATELLRQSWIKDNLGATQRRQIQQRLGEALRPADHAARLDRLLWDRQWDAAEAMLPLVESNRRRLAAARLRLQKQAPGVDAAVERVPARLQRDPGLLFDRIKWRRQKGFHDAARELLLSTPDDTGQPAAWWYERHYHIRDRIDERQFMLAARLAKGHRQSGGSNFAEAQWLAGWLSLRHLDEPKTALQRFATMYDAVRSPISRGRAAYWAGRAAQAAGRPAEARDWYRKGAVQVTSFYGQQAAAELGSTPALDMPVLADAEFGAEPARELADLARLLCGIDEGDAAMPFLRQLALDPNGGDRAMTLAVECQRADIAVELAKFGVRAGVMDPLLSFPIPEDILAHSSLDDPALVLAVSRQESHFDAQARSSAGAMGLMQLMPPTARAVGRRHGRSFKTVELRGSPELNVTLGTAYLEGLIANYDGCLELAIAAYNAGPGRVRAWVDRHGDPCSMSPHDRLDWLETIPFAETRNYVQRVLEARSVYARLLASEQGVKVALRTPLGPVVPPPVPSAKPG